MKRWLRAAAWVALSMSLMLPVGCNLGTAPGGTEGEGLTGILVDGSGAPLAQVTVRVHPRTRSSLAKGQAAPATLDSTFTDARGRFDFKDLNDGRYNVSGTLVRQDSTLALFIQNVAYPGGRKDLGSRTLQASGGISFHLESDTALPAGVVCRVPGSPYQSVVDASGHCVLSGVAPGTYQVEVTAPGYETTGLSSVKVVSGIQSDAGHLDLVDNPTPAPRIRVIADADAVIGSSVNGYPDNNALSNVSRGKIEVVSTGTYDVYSASRSLMKFTIPPGYKRANIERAVIRLTTKSWVDKNVTAPFRIDLHRMLKSWKEGNVGGEPLNSAAVDGATSLERFWGNQDGSEDWSEKFVGLNGIDAVALPAATQTKSPGDMTAWEFDVTELVKAWADDPSQNFGVLLATVFPTTNATVPDYPDIYAREAAVESTRPALIINDEVTGPPDPLPRTVLQVTEDAAIWATTTGSPMVASGYNHGGGPGLSTGIYDLGTATRTLVRIALPPGITSSQITRARFRMHSYEWMVKNVAPVPGYRVYLHQMLRSWKEGTALTQQSNSAAVDGATAYERFWGDQSGAEDWNQVFVGLDGVDAVAATAATSSIGDRVLGPIEFDITAMAKFWADNPSQNFGFIMRGDIPSSNEQVTHYPTFYSSEGPVQSQRPQLILNGE
jgi:hypothetical protein